MRTSGWAEMLLTDAVGDDGGTREIRLRELRPGPGGARPPCSEEVRADLFRAVARGRLVAGPAELRCPAYHLAWSGPRAEVERARVGGCPMCSAPGERLRLEETFFVPPAVAREILARRRVRPEITAETRRVHP